MNEKLHQVAASLRAVFWPQTAKIEESVDRLNQVLDQRVERRRELEQSAQRIGREL